MLETEHLVRFSFFIFLAIAFQVSAQTFPVEKVDENLKAGINLLLNQRYKNADSVFQSLEKNFPELPFGKIYQAANSIAQSLDFGEEFNHDFIIKKLEESVEISESRIDEDENNIWNNYFMALSKGYLAYFLALEENYFDAFAEGYLSISFFERCEKINPGFYETQIASGTLLYWKSEKADWIPFVGDDKSKGIEILENVIKHKTYNYYVAVNSLLWIYINEKEYGKAVQTAEIVLNEYPENRYFQWGIARAYEGINEEKAVQVYSNILESLIAESKLNIFNEVTLKHKIAQLYERMKNYKAALNYCSEILTIKNIPENQFQRLENRFERAAEQKQRLLSLINKE